MAALVSLALASVGSIALAQPAPPPPEESPAEPPETAQPGDPPPPIQPPLPEPPPPEPPPSEPPPSEPPMTPPLGTTPAPAGPGMVPPSPPGLDLGEAPEEPEEPPPPERTLGLQLGAGLDRRLGGDASGISDDEPVDLTFGAGVWFAPNRLWSLGLGYQRLGLGGGRTPARENSVSVQRDIDTVWAGGRAYPVRSDAIGLYVALALGASWQRASASGSRSGAISGVSAPEAFSCSASDGPGFALGGGVGVDVDIDRNLAFLVQIDGTGHRLTSETLDGCVAGSGSVTAIGAQLGFMYRFDLDAEPRPSRRARHNVRSDSSEPLQ
jgi:hypothetical protein